MRTASLTQDPRSSGRDGGDAAYIRVTEANIIRLSACLRQGKHVVYLKRMAIGSLALDPELKPGEWRELTDDEVDAAGTVPGEELWDGIVPNGMSFLYCNK